MQLLTAQHFLSNGKLKAANSPRAYIYLYKIYKYGVPIFNQREKKSEHAEKSGGFFWVYMHA